ncbi:hypothetical protein NP493_1195g00001 [Ridgeia piscesae]|uniref:FAD-binding FR-type domain-containing protein n=1 Tax=Ridgeia piscesae TaxID=27915 RepID=A0AAD9KDT4_RIDPI|nr:hypothetical protein NP493_1195g00001 [Ridgeia piscesae]
MSFSFSFILLTMCRNLITKLRETVLNQYLPFDAHVTFHVIVAYTAFFFMFLHVFGYCFIFYEVSTQPAEFLCIFREVSLSPTFLPKFHYWLFGTLPGATGVLLIAVICVMYIFAQPLVRTYIFNAFWVSHKLFYLLYVLTLLHGCVRLLQEPNFSYYFAGPAILFTLDKIVSLSRRKRELTILRMEQLPSDITYIEFKRPANFEYKSGQWVRLACTALGKEEYHSLTLTSAPHENTLSVYILACGPWSWNLRRLADQQNQDTNPYPKVNTPGV